jgi:hypothetical protein
MKLPKLRRVDHRMHQIVQRHGDGLSWNAYQEFTRSVWYWGVLPIWRANHGHEDKPMHAFIRRATGI